MKRRPDRRCIGQQGHENRGIVDGLNGEKIDVINQRGPGIHAARSLRDCRRGGVDGEIEQVIVDPDQLSLAIGNEGPNSRLAPSTGL